MKGVTERGLEDQVGSILYVMEALEAGTSGGELARQVQSRDRGADYGFKVRLLSV